jgi:hypothetical protein
MHHDTFNADFYITAATIIPILYLALTLQGQSFERLAEAHKRNHDVPRDKRKGRWTLLEALFLSAPYFILISGIVGELLAIFALYNRMAPAGAGPYVLMFTLFLLAAVAAGPVLSYNAMFSEYGANPPGDNSQEPSGSPEDDSAPPSD